MWLMQCWFNIAAQHNETALYCFTNLGKDPYLKSKVPFLLSADGFLTSHCHGNMWTEKLKWNFIFVLTRLAELSTIWKHLLPSVMVNFEYQFDWIKEYLGFGLEKQGLLFLLSTYMVAQNCVTPVSGNMMPLLASVGTTNVHVARTHILAKHPST